MVEGEVRDPISKTFWKTLLDRSNSNTEIYREIFGCDPDNTARNVVELNALRERVARRKPEEQLEIYERLKGEIKGHVVDWPSHFMEKENLALGWTQLEGLLPEVNFL